MEERMICSCGLTCCDCLFYQSEIYEAAQKFREVLKKYEFDKFLNILSNKIVLKAMQEHLELDEAQMWDKVGRHFETFTNIPEFMSTLDSIIGLQYHKTCREASGCSIAGETHMCSSLKCVNAKGYKGCWECNLSETCDKLKFVRNSYGNVIDENFSTAREKGTEAVISHGNKYYVWQRR